MPVSIPPQLPPDLEQFVDEAVRDGRYPSSADVFQSALRLLRDEHVRLRELRQELDEAQQSLDRGEGIHLPDPAALRVFCDDFLEQRERVADIQK